VYYLGVQNNYSYENRGFLRMLSTKRIICDKRDILREGRDYQLKQQLRVAA
jgi:hypothetical protein